MKTFQYYKQLLKDLNQPFNETPFGNVLIIHPTTSCYFEALPQTQVIHTHLYAFLLFDYETYDHDKYSEKDTIEHIHNYVKSRGGEI